MPRHGYIRLNYFIKHFIAYFNYYICDVIHTAICTGMNFNLSKHLKKFNGFSGFS